MARKNSSSTVEDELEAAASESALRSRRYDESPLDARMLDLDDEEESPFLRGQKRVPVRRGALPRKAASRLKIALICASVVVGAGLIWFGLHQYATQSWRFRIDSSDNIAITGASKVSRAQIMEVMAGDIDRNIFFVPLEVRKKQLEEIPWVQSASVMRLLPDRLKISITERIPVAFVELNSHIELIDAQGVIMEQLASPSTGYSFPVIVGMSDAEPLSTRAARMKMYVRLMKELDASGAHYSRDLSDVDLSDPDDVKATVTDAHGAVLVHLGSSNFLEKFQTYVTHVQEWRAQFQRLQSVDLRYEHQVIVNPDPIRETAPTVNSQAKATADVKPAAPATKKAAHKAKKH
jgi:cell division protein FtsQ